MVGVGGAEEELAYHATGGKADGGRWVDMDEF